MNERLRGELDLVSSARIADLLTEFQDAMQCSAESSATGLEAVTESLQTEAALLSEALRNEVAVAASASMARITVLSASLQDLACSSDLENFSSSLHGKIAILEDRMDAQQASASEAIEALGASSARVAAALRATIQEEASQVFFGDALAGRWRTAASQKSVRRGSRYVGAMRFHIKY